MTQFTAGRRIKIVGCVVLMTLGCSKNPQPPIPDSGKNPETEKMRPLELGNVLAGNIDLRAKLQEPPEDLSNLPAAASLQVGELLKDWQQGQDFFLRKYYGRVLEISGSVSGVGWRSYMGPFVNLKSDDPKQSVMCVVVDAEPWAKVLPGQKAKVKGKCYQPFM